MPVDTLDAQVIDLTKIDPAIAIANLTEQILQCRELGHQWRHLHFQRSPNWGIQRVLKCPCGTERKDTLNTWGRVAQRQYTYPQGYQMRGTQEYGVNRETFRREVLRRAGWLSEERLQEAV